MLSNGAAREAGTSLLDRIRSATQPDHVALEETLALLAPPMRRANFLRAIGGFHAFHRRWEPALEAMIGDAALLEPRRKLALLERDLAALGAGAECVGASPSGDVFDLGFLDTASAAWGSLYVMEGSTLGGQVISKALRGATWLPPGGLTYFNPYGRATAAMWAQFRDALQARSTELDGVAAIKGARATFAALRVGLAAPARVAA